MLLSGSLNLFYFSVEDCPFVLDASLWRILLWHYLHKGSFFFGSGILRKTEQYSKVYWFEFQHTHVIAANFIATAIAWTAKRDRNLLALLAKALGVSADQLLGIKEVKSNGRKKDNRLWRRFSQAEQLPQSQRKQIVQILDAFLERDNLKKAS